MDEPMTFKEKLDYWRSSGHSPFASQAKDFFQGPTQREMAREITDSADREGREIEPVGRGRWV
jgi:hypothetical protein